MNNRVMTGLPAAPRLALSGGSSRQLYRVGRGWQEQACQQLPDRDERARCEPSAATSCGRDKAKAEAVKKPAP